MPVKKKKRTHLKWTIRIAKEQVIKKGLMVSPEYDKRFLNTWLYTLGQNVEPVLKVKLIHKKRKSLKPFTMKRLMELSK